MYELISLRILDFNLFVCSTKNKNSSCTSIGGTIIFRDFIASKFNQINDYVKALDYLTIDTSKIKIIGDANFPFVPVWEREKRDQRFDVRPIVANENRLIFSPAVMHELATMWEVGLQEFYPPYEINLNNFTSVLKQWKTECETQMETDIEHLCKNVGYITYKNLKLNKVNKKQDRKSVV